MFNNVYFKNLPDDFDEEKVREIFSPYGRIESLVLKKNDIGKFGFICFMPKPEEKDNREYGPKCA